MKCMALLLAPLLTLAFGCNTAQISTPALVDAGAPCPEQAPAVSCDAGPAQTAGACAGGVTVAIDSAEDPDASNTIPAAYYPLGCTVQFFVPDTSSASCLRAQPCTCSVPDAGASDGGDGGGAAQSAPGVWECFPAQPQ
jgi:hypothetical protein